MEYFIPDIYQKSIYFIDYQKLYDNGIRCLLFDLDNTCVPLVVKEPNKKLKDLFDDLKDLGFKVIIFSNASRKRLEPFKSELGVDCCAHSCKPRKDKFLKIMKKFKFDLSEVAIIGDQLYTDILGGNLVGITTILINPLSENDHFFTKFFRILERKKMIKMSKKGYFTMGKYYD